MFFIPAMLLWAITAGYGFRACLANLTGRRKVIWSCVIFALLPFDFFGAPRSVLRLPSSLPYKIVANAPAGTSVLHLPYRNEMKIYLYFQCQQQKPMLNAGYARRLNHDLESYGDSFPVFSGLKNISSMDAAMIDSNDRQSAADFQWFFNLRHIILHKNYMLEHESITDCRAYIEKLFNVSVVWEDDSVILFDLRAPTPPNHQELPSRIEFDGHENNVILLGWSSPEKNAAGLSWQWSEGTQSTMILKVDHLRDYLLLLNVSPFTCNENEPQRLTVAMNGRTLKQIQPSGGFQTYEVRVPADALQQGYNELTFYYRYACSPLEKRIGSDPRELAMAFDWVRFVPLH